MLLLVWGTADRLEPGFGTAAAVTLGLGTLVLPYTTQDVIVSASSSGGVIAGSV